MEFAVSCSINFDFPQSMPKRRFAPAGDVSPESQAASEFTVEMQVEFLRLKSLLEKGKEGDDFPWATFENLQERERLNASNSPYISSYGSGSYLKAHDTVGNSTQPDQAKAVKPNSEGKVASKGRSSSSFLSFFGVKRRPEAASAGKRKPLAPKSAVSTSVVAPTLESLCKGNDDKRRGELAKKMDDMWADVKSKTIASNHPTACAAVYKMAERLGMVHEATPSAQWKRMLLERYGISVTEAMGKYKVEHPVKSSVFRKAVLDSYAFAQQNLAPMAKAHPLPPIYQQLPVYTQTGKDLSDV